MDPDEANAHGDRWWMPFLAGLVVGGAGLVLARTLAPRAGIDRRLLKSKGEDAEIPPTIVVPGILGSELLRPDGTHVWLNARNAMGYHDLALPLSLPLGSSHDGLVPGGLLGTKAVLPRLFGFTEYADLVDLLLDTGVRHHVFTYDWRRDIVDSARRLGVALDALAEERRDPEARFNVLGHSMGGLVARYYLRYGGSEPGEVTGVPWAGAQRIRNLILVATPNSGSIPALDAILNGNRVGFSATTLASSVISTMPAIYQLLPPGGTNVLLDHATQPLELDLHDPATWERLGWGPFGRASTSRRRTTEARSDADPEIRRAFLAAVLARAREVHQALTRRPTAPCPARVVALGGDCIPTLGKAVVPERAGVPPRFEPRTRREADVMLEAGDGRVTRASVLASHLPEAEDSDLGCGLSEVTSAFFGSADHHGIYGEPTFQSVLVRLLLRRARSSALRAAGAA